GRDWSREPGTGRPAPAPPAGPRWRTWRQDDAALDGRGAGRGGRAARARDREVRRDAGADECGAEHAVEQAETRERKTASFADGKSAGDDVHRRAPSRGFRDEALRRRL